MFLAVERWDNAAGKEESFVAEVSLDVVEREGYDALFNDGGHWTLNVVEFETEEEALDFLRG